MIFSLNSIFRYNRLVRPTANANDTIRIEFKLKLNQIVDVHAKHQTLTVIGWLLHHWYDYRLSWNPEEYGGVKNLYVPGEMIWLPDIILYNKIHISVNLAANIHSITSAMLRMWLNPLRIPKG
ncbi:unnamed protein product [Angiostrongylus costaricensis]|uniref:Neur_chan_LBD domain-containing protein n=1 Tax=Angiostrongylus costaricensis TaxID=334426 RepID=A0A0R3PLI4_ANGCS|nr:unnamed protein product [Angiostrongylus costaricensis]